MGKVSIDDKEQFFRYCRFIAYCDAELTINPQTRDKKEELIDDHINNSMDLFHNDDILEESITIDEIEEVIDPILQYDIVKGVYLADDEECTKAVAKISFNMIMNMYKKLEREGKVELAWDKDSQDFTYVPTGK